MATKDIPDELVCWAYVAYKQHLKPLGKSSTSSLLPPEILEKWTGQHSNVCYRACERACDRGLIEFGVSLRTGWLTEKGEALLKEKAPSGELEAKSNGGIVGAEGKTLRIKCPR